MFDILAKKATKTSETRKFEFLIAKKNKKESIHYKKWENMLL